MNKPSSEVVTIQSEGRVLIGEPLTRKDGRPLALYSTHETLEVVTGGVVSSYYHSEVEYIGEGDWQDGVVRIRGAERSRQPLGGEFKAFYEELEAARQNGLL